MAFGAPTFPSSEIRNGLIAGRAHLELAAFDMSVSYLNGYAQPEPRPYQKSGQNFIQHKAIMVMDE